MPGQGPLAPSHFCIRAQVAPPVIISMAVVKKRKFEGSMQEAMEEGERIIKSGREGRRRRRRRRRFLDKTCKEGGERKLLTHQY